MTARLPPSIAEALITTTIDGTLRIDVRDLAALVADRERLYRLAAWLVSLESDQEKRRRVTLEEILMRTRSAVNNAVEQLGEQDEVHVYLSTSCHHHDHGYCGSSDGYDAAGDPFPKRPGQCKWCAAPCVCDCHGASVDLISARR